ncbi:secretin N-terminal domain-containing protein [Alkalinema sp. FACHB-956]|uniref:secretin N-terminal domain-containing protein n=1 Tax=Alkalinema sp. FACHB-956 TaxID=2692768 RepID=UPI001684484F|nr:AMIN domain-containing protein [Alkalinema sp. FACHB-956]
MRQFREISGALAATVALVAVAHPAFAASTQVTDVQVSPSQTGFDVILKTQSEGGKAPQVFNTNRGNTWTGFIFNAQLAKNQPLRQDNPAPGIASVMVSPVNNGVQVTVVGQNGTPTGQITRKDGGSVVFSVNGKPGDNRIAQAPPAPSAAPTPAPSIAPFVPNPTAPRTAPVAPITPVPPLLPKASPPPVGDMAVAQIDTSPSYIDLGTSERIPRLVLRDAPVREVLSLLARAAGMNLAFAETPGSGPGAAVPGAPGSGSSSGGPTVSLDIENESVQDVFNYVLRIACVAPSGASSGAPGGGSQCASLEANRVGRTVFVGPRLPDDARNVISRTIRLNQTTTENASNFLTTQGAETQLPITQVQVQTVGEGAAARTIETRTPTILALRANEGVGPLILRGLSVSGDNRLNSITLTGSPRKVAIATALLTQLDARKRQASVSVKIIDVNLLGINRAGTSFSFNINDTNVVNSGGTAIINLGSRSPASAPATLVDQSVGLAPVSVIPPISFDVGNRWLGQLQAAIVNQNAKILTDPTLVVQEGQNSQVKLTEEVITNFKVETQAGSPPTVTVTIEKQEAGLTLDLAVERIDDNGFISMRIKPVIKSPQRTESVSLPAGGQIAQQQVTLLQSREVNTGLIRIRDGQSLLLTGVIQEADRANVRKVPILGDLPLLGALFRRTERQNERKEVIVLVTPKIVDDSDRSTFGFGYNPSKEAQQMLQKSNN